MTVPPIETLVGLLEQSAAGYPDRVAVASREGLRTRALSYRTLLDASEAIASALTMRHGLQPGQRVILLAPSGIRSVAALFGLFRARIVAVPLDLNSTPAFVAAVRGKTEAAAIIGPRALEIADGPCRISLEDLDLSLTAGPLPPEPGPDDVAEIVFTSGTTGAPKGVMLTHRNIISDLRGVSRLVPEREAMRLVSILPLSHMFEQTVGLYLPLLRGGCVHYAPSLRPSAIATELRRRRATGMVVVPRFLSLMMAAVEDRARSGGRGRSWAMQHRIAKSLPLPMRRILFLPLHRGLGGHLRYFLCGGAALPAELMRGWERTGIRIVEGYGATECGPVVAANCFEDRLPGCVGRPIDGVSVRLSDEGELQVKGPNVFASYWEDASHTTAAFTADGWYRTEDIAEMTDDGRLRIVGRMSDRIVLPSGMNVFPADVEAALARQPGVGECAVLGMAEAGGGERIHAAIRPAEGADPASISTAVNAANAALASHQRIMGFTLWREEFPKTALQKIKRAALRESLVHALSGGEAERLAQPDDPAGALLRRVLKNAPAAFAPEMQLEGDLGLDSLGRMELAAQIETDTGRDMPEDVIARLTTVGDLAVLLSTPLPRADRIPLARWPRGRAASLARRVIQPILLFLPHTLFARPYRVTGREALAGASGQFLFVANHASHADTVAILRALPPHLRRRTAVAAAADYFFARRWIGRLTALVLNAFPFSREGRVRESLENCGMLCDEGWSILIYPEGTRSPAGRLLPFKQGIGLLATGLGVPVVPIAVTGGASLLPMGASWPRRAAVTIRFGLPVTISPAIPPGEATALLQGRVAELLSLEMEPQTGGGHDG